MAASSMAASNAAPLTPLGSLTIEDIMKATSQADKEQLHSTLLQLLKATSPKKEETPDDRIPTASIKANGTHPAGGLVENSGDVRASGNVERQDSNYRRSHSLPDMSSLREPAAQQIQFDDEDEDYLDSDVRLRTKAMSPRELNRWRLSLFSVYVGRLPQDITRREIGELFRQAGNVLDIHIQPPEGNSHYTYGFIRFKTLEEAEEAVSMFNGRVLGNRHLTVQFSQETRRIIANIQDKDQDDLPLNSSDKLLRKSYPEVKRTPVAEVEEEKIQQKLRQSMAKLQTSCQQASAEGSGILKQLEDILNKVREIPNPSVATPTSDEGPACPFHGLVKRDVQQNSPPQQQSGAPFSPQERQNPAEGSRRQEEVTPTDSFVPTPGNVKWQVGESPERNDIDSSQGSPLVNNQQSPGDATQMTGKPVSRNLPGHSYFGSTQTSFIPTQVLSKSANDREPLQSHSITSSVKYPSLQLRDNDKESLTSVHDTKAQVSPSRGNAMHNRSPSTLLPTQGAQLPVSSPQTSYGGGNNKMPAEQQKTLNTSPSYPYQMTTPQMRSPPFGYDAQNRCAERSPNVTSSHMEFSIPANELPSWTVPSGAPVETSSLESSKIVTPPSKGSALFTRPCYQENESLKGHPLYDGAFADADICRPPKDAVSSHVEQKSPSSKTAPAPLPSPRQATMLPSSSSRFVVAANFNVKNTSTRMSDDKTALMRASVNETTAYKVRNDEGSTLQNDGVSSSSSMPSSDVTSSEEDQSSNEHCRFCHQEGRACAHSDSSTKCHLNSQSRNSPVGELSRLNYSTDMGLSEFEGLPLNKNAKPSVGALKLSGIPEQDVRVKPPTPESISPRIPAGVGRGVRKLPDQGVRVTARGRIMNTGSTPGNLYRPFSPPSPGTYDTATSKEKSPGRVVNPREDTVGNQQTITNQSPSSPNNEKINGNLSNRSPSPTGRQPPSFGRGRGLGRSPFAGQMKSPPGNLEDQQKAVANSDISRHIAAGRGTSQVSRQLRVHSEGNFSSQTNPSEVKRAELLLRNVSNGEAANGPNSMSKQSLPPQKHPYCAAPPVQHPSAKSFQVPGMPSQLPTYGHGVRPPFLANSTSRPTLPVHYPGMAGQPPLTPGTSGHFPAFPHGFLPPRFTANPMFLQGLPFAMDPHTRRLQMALGYLSDQYYRRLANAGVLQGINPGMDPILGQLPFFRNPAQQMFGNPMFGVSSTAAAGNVPSVASQPPPDTALPNAASSPVVDVSELESYLKSVYTDIEKAGFIKTEDERFVPDSSSSPKRNSEPDAPPVAVASSVEHEESGTTLGNTLHVEFNASLGNDSKEKSDAITSSDGDMGSKGSNTNSVDKEASSVLENNKSRAVHGLSLGTKDNPLLMGKDVYRGDGESRVPLGAPSAHDSRESSSTAMIMTTDFGEDVRREVFPKTGLPSEETAMLGLPSEVTATRALPSEETATRALPSEETATRALPSEETATRGLPSEVTATRALPSEETATRGLPSEETATRALPSEETATRALPSEETATRGLPSEVTATRALPSEETATRALPSEETATRGLPSEETATRALPSEETATRALPSEETATHGLPCEEKIPVVTDNCGNHRSGLDMDHVSSRSPSHVPLLLEMKATLKELQEENKVLQASIPPARPDQIASRMYPGERVTEMVEKIHRQQVAYQHEIEIITTRNAEYDLLFEREKLVAGYDAGALREIEAELGTGILENEIKLARMENELLSLQHELHSMLM